MPRTVLRSWPQSLGHTDRDRSSKYLMSEQEGLNGWMMRAERSVLVDSFAPQFKEASLYR